MRYLSFVAKFWLLLAVLCVCVYLAVNNQDRLHLQLPPFIDHITVPAYVAFCACFVLGAMMMTLYHSVESLKKSLEIRRLKKRLRLLGDSVDTADAAPGGRSGPYVPPEPLP